MASDIEMTAAAAAMVADGLGQGCAEKARPLVVFEHEPPPTGPLRGHSGCCKTCRRYPQKRPGLKVTLCTALVVLTLGCVAAFVWLPQAIINSRLQRAMVDIADAVVEVGPDADATIQPKARLSMAKEILQLPLVSYTAEVRGVAAEVYFKRTAADSASNVHVGTFKTSATISCDSSKDLDVSLGGQMELSDASQVSDMVSDYITNPSVTLTMQAKFNIHAKVWGWMPFVLYGIQVSKSLTVPALNKFHENNITLGDLVSVSGAPGALDVSAIARIYNPSPVTLISHDSFTMQVFYTWKGARYKMGTLSTRAPLILKPLQNEIIGDVTVVKTENNENAMQAAIADYIGPQKGYERAGALASPLVVTIADGRSASPLLHKICQRLSVDVNFQPKPLHFLTDVTADITAFSTIKPPFYSVVVHLDVRNPLPQQVRVKSLTLRAHHLNLSGPLLYEYSRDIKEPEFDPGFYTLDALEEVIVDFPLAVLSEVKWGFLFSTKQIRELVSQGIERKVTLGIDLLMDLEIKGGFEQQIHYKNDALSGILCFHATTTEQACGGLPPMTPHTYSPQSVRALSIV